LKASPSVRGQEKITGRAPKPSTPRGRGPKKTPQQQEKEDKIVAKLLQEDRKFLDFSQSLTEKVRIERGILEKRQSHPLPLL